MADPYLHADEVPGAIDAAQHVVPLVLDVVGPVRSVADLGGGTGAWLREFQRHGVETVRLYDTVDVRETLLVDAEAFEVVDLERAFPPVRRADLAVCVEVAEHLSAGRAEALVDWLTGTADLVVFSAAVTGQGGKEHVNEQAPAYWTGLFEAHGFMRRDVLRGPLIYDRSVPWWYRQNLFVYVGPGAVLATDRPDFLPDECVLIHETSAALQEPAPPPAVGLRGWLRAFRPALAGTLGHRLRR